MLLEAARAKADSYKAVPKRLIHDQWKADHERRNNVNVAVNAFCRKRCPLLNLTMKGFVTSV